MGDVCLAGRLRLFVGEAAGNCRHTYPQWQQTPVTGDPAVVIRGLERGEDSTGQGIFMPWRLNSPKRCDE